MARGVRLLPLLLVALQLAHTARPHTAEPLAYDDEDSDPTATVTATATAYSLALSTLAADEHSSGELDNKTAPLFPEDLFTEEQRRNGAIILHILGLIYMFVALAVVCDEFFVPSLDVIIEKLQISDDVAGATFMAAGGSAPELFTSVIGVFVSFDDVGIGTIVGSAVFNILFVIGMCALFSRTVLSLTWWPLFRDCTFYSASLIALIYFFRDNHIYWQEALVLFAIYITYVSFMRWNTMFERLVKKVLYKNRVTRVRSTDQLMPAGGNAATSSETSVGTGAGGGSRTGAVHQPGAPPHGNHKFRHGLLQLMIHTIDPMHDGKVDEKATQLHAIASLKVLLDATKPGGSSGSAAGAAASTASTTASAASAASAAPTTLADLPNGGMMDGMDMEDDTPPTPLDMSWPSGARKRVTYLLLAPIIFPLWLTLPDARTPKGKRLFPVTFLGSIVWIAAYSYLMVWWANVVGDTAHIPPEVMGLTFLAAGTSIPDLITSVIVARKGFGDMAVSSSVGSNIFDVTVGTNAELRKFPKNFKFGAATASYQIEGAWNVSDKSENIWDNFVHNTNLINGRATGDVACDSYHLYKRDVEMLSELGVDYYRFSISWTRLLPNGFANKISEDGLRYYNALIDELISKNIQPYVTLYHWDLPQNLQLLGGWLNPIMADYFADYAQVAFEAFGDRVKNWLTFNEPADSCIEGYDSRSKAPGLNMHDIGAYLCAHTILKAHAKVYHLYDQQYRSTQKGRISMTLDSGWYEPESDKEEEQADIAIQFHTGWFAHPLFSQDGDYPKVMKEMVAKKSKDQGYPKSRLPEFTQDEIDYIKGTCDYFGLNHYTTWMIKKKPWMNIEKNNTLYDDTNFIQYQKPEWPKSASSWLKVVPWGFTKMLRWISKQYNNVETVVFENGFSDKDGVEDSRRVDYIQSYLNALLDAIEQGSNVTAYTAWSLMDNFEWLAGYSQRFGMYHVDFNDPNRTRTPKQSAHYYSNVIKNRAVNGTLEDHPKVIQF